MSGIYIPNLKMPPKCEGCAFERWGREYGEYCLLVPYTGIGSDWTEEIRKTGRRDDCPIVPFPEQRWIPVTERLPEEDCVGTTVLCVLEKKKRYWRWVDIRLFMDGDFWHPKGQKGKVTHWMPLPEPPKEETE